MSAAAYVARRERLRVANSYTRMQAVLDLNELLSGSEWWAMLGAEWPSCDNIWRHRTELRRHLRSASRKDLDAMMTVEERAALAALPAKLLVYRGCGEKNWRGLSWTLDRSVAERFPRMMRYMPLGAALVVTGTLPRERAVLKLDRGEAEIIAAAKVSVIGGQALIESECLVA